MSWFQLLDSLQDADGHSEPAPERLVPESSFLLNPTFLRQQAREPVATAPKLRLLGQAQ